MRNGIVCGGNLVLDLIKVIESYPEEGMLTDILTVQRNGGGAIINVLTNLSVMDDSIPLFAAGLLGNDENGNFLFEQLTKFNIDTSGISTTDKAATSYTDVMTDKNNGNRTFFHQRGANALLDIEHFENISPSAKIFHLGYLLILDQLDSDDEEFGTKAARLFYKMKCKGYKTSADLVSVAHSRFKQIVEPSLKYLDYLIINEVEAEMATGIIIRKYNLIDQTALKETAHMLLKKGVNELVVIHFPEGGYLLTVENNEFYVPSEKIDSSEIKGSVGAGDAFCAGMLYGLHEGYDIEKCLKIANTTAWFNLQNETSTGGAVSINNILENL